MRKHAVYINSQKYSSLVLMEEIQHQLTDAIAVEFQGTESPQRIYYRFAPGPTFVQA
jgi:hypothetical protein